MSSCSWVAARLPIPHRRRAHVALQMRELLLGQVLAPVDAMICSGPVADQAVLGDGQVARPRCQPNSTGHYTPSSTSTDVTRHQRTSSSAYGTSTSFPFAAERLSSS